MLLTVEQKNTKNQEKSEENHENQLLKSRDFSSGEKSKNRSSLNKSGDLVTLISFHFKNQNF
jgi:hypothetical protein